MSLRDDKIYVRFDDMTAREFDAVEEMEVVDEAIRILDNLCLSWDGYYKYDPMWYPEPFAY